MTKQEGDCCDIKVKKVKDGVEIKVAGQDIESCLAKCLKSCCGDKSDK